MRRLMVHAESHSNYSCSIWNCFTQGLGQAVGKPRVILLPLLLILLVFRWQYRVSVLAMSKYFKHVQRFRYNEEFVFVTTRR